MRLGLGVVDDDFLTFAQSGQDSLSLSEFGLRVVRTFYVGPAVSRETDDSSIGLERGR